MAKERTVWQVACGDAGREYWGWFLDYDVMLIGPGDTRDWISKADQNELREIIKGSFDALNRFIQCKKGDIVVLRKQADPIAIGVVRSDYLWKEEFDDVNGWDLQHCRRVVWYTAHMEKQNGHKCYRGLDQQKNAKPLPGLEGLFKGYQNRFCQPGKVEHEIRTFVKDNKIIENLDKAEKRKPLSELPSIVKKREFATITKDLKRAGLSGKALDKVATTIRRELVPLIEHYRDYRMERSPSEDETRTHLVVPLLEALGWRKERIIVEWSQVDVALLPDNSNNPNDCQIYFELKRFCSPLTGETGGLKQAKDYAPKFDNPRYMVLTDGSRFRILEKEEGEWIDTVPIDDWPNLYRCTGLENLSPLVNGEGKV